MASGTEDDALTWGGDDDPTLDVGAKPTRGDAVVLPEGFTAVGGGSEMVTESEVPVDASDDLRAAAGAPTPMSNAMLISTGVFIGVYALYTVGWLIGGQRLSGYAQFLVAPAAYTVFLVLSVVAPALWFAAVWLLTRSSKAWLRIVWLVVGIALLVPWPFAMIGAVGQ